MTTINCPECDADVAAGADLLVGELLVCPDCDAELEVTSLAPLTVELAPEVEEDWGE
ncbi:MAG: lysine biosynthesis protein LysW [Anaerolineales bacterium]|nr:lysine biosynthesis protein LysW [Anaerolineales bacterium]MCB0009616.1 lysine biosynthesis protein LysW [Anaerolineales bacterium]